MILRLTIPALVALGLAACKSTDTDVNYDTSDPYGVPDYGTPDYGAETASYESVNPPADATYGPAAYEESTPSPAPSRPPAATSGPTRSHVVAKGDTLWGLSRKYGVSVDSIRSANSLSGDKIVLGQTLRIPSR